MNVRADHKEREGNASHFSIWDRLNCGELGSLVRRLAEVATADHVNQDAARNGGTFVGTRFGRIER